MNYRNLRNLMLAGVSRLVMSIDGEEGGEAQGGAGGEAAGGGEAGDGGQAGGAEEGGEAGGEPAPAGAGEGGGEAGGEPAAAAAPKSTRVPWQTKRIDTLTATAKTAQEEAAAARREADEARRQVAAYQALYGTDAVPPAPGAAGAPAAAPVAAPAAGGAGRTYSEDEFNAAVANRAKLQTLDSTLESWYQDGVKTGGDAFKAKITAVGQAFGAELASRVDFYEAVTSLPNGAQVYDQLMGDLDHFADVLAMNPLQLGMELGRLSSAAGSTKPKAPKVSGAPAPITPITGAAGADFDPETASMDDYMKDFEARQERRHANR